jgi:hypothetical protein
MWHDLTLYGSTWLDAFLTGVICQLSASGCAKPRSLIFNSIIYTMYHLFKRDRFTLCIISKRSIFSCNLKWNHTPKNDEMALCPANVICHVICHRGYVTVFAIHSHSTPYLMFPALPRCFHLRSLTTTYFC